MRNEPTQAMEVMFTLSSYNYSKPRTAVLHKGTNVNIGASPNTSGLRRRRCHQSAHRLGPHQCCQCAVQIAEAQPTSLSALV